MVDADIISEIRGLEDVLSELEGSGEYYSILSREDS